MKHVRFFAGFVAGLVWVVILAILVRIGEMIFRRDSFSFFDIVFLGILGIIVGTQSLKGEKLRDLKFWEGWGMLLGIFTMVLACYGIAPEPILKAGIMGIGYIFGRWLGIEKMKKSRRS